MTPPILGIFASAVTGGVSTNSYESISTVTVGSGGSSSITFSSIPNTYTHLQIRGIMQTDRGTYPLEEIKMNFNSDTNANYAYHQLAGDGGSAYAQGGSSKNYIQLEQAGTSTGGTWGGIVLDILDYASTNKNKTTRALAGYSQVTGAVGGYYGIITLNSGLWTNSSTAISSITFAPRYSTQFNQYTQLALYGIKAAS